MMKACVPLLSAVERAVFFKPFGGDRWSCPVFFLRRMPVAKAAFDVWRISASAQDYRTAARCWPVFKRWQIDSTGSSVSGVSALDDNIIIAFEPGTFRRGQRLRHASLRR